MAKTSMLQQSGQIGSIQTKNRIVMPAMGTGLGSINGEVTPQMIRYYEERAIGGAGMIIVEIACVDSPGGRGSLTQLGIDHPRYIFGLNELTEAIHAHDCRAMIQLHHAGRQTSGLMTDGIQPVAPSAQACKLMRAMPRELSREEIVEIKNKFVSAAFYAYKAGFDGVELHAAHGYLLSQFLSPYTNQRSDEYGGSTANRARLLLEIISTIKQKIPQLAVSVRLNIVDFVPGGLEQSEGLDIAAMVEEAGADLINVSNGIYESGQTNIEPASFREGWRIYLAEAVKARVKIPVLAGGVIRHPDFADQFIASGKTDFVWVGRGMLADPHWASKALQGQAEEIRPCISCNHCIARSFAGLRIRCAVNPNAAREWRLHDFDSLKGLRVVVVGGGPAGMQAAISLARSGASVDLMESSPKLGGLLNIASQPPHKERLAELTNYLIREVELSGVKVHLNTTFTPDMLTDYKADVLVIAVGARPVVPGIKGLDQRSSSLEEILSGQVKVNGEKVVVIGGGSSGCELGEYLVDRDNVVTIVEQGSQLAVGLENINRLDLLGRLKKKGVNIKTSCNVEMLGEGVRVYNSKKEQEEFLTADRIVITCGYEADHGLYKAVKEKVKNLFLIGDANAARGIQEALEEATLVAYRLGQTRERFSDPEIN